MNFVRKMVSKKKRRFEWGTFDLDLTYITDRIIAMGFPSESIEGLYRNHMKDVQRFFNTLHSGHYKVFNLCSERKYTHDKFEFNVSEYPFDDHSPPPLDIISEFCADVEDWLERDPENIVAIHCKAGKGRTGTMIACWLLFNKSCQTGSESMRLFANKRTHNGKGITIPSQVRYVRYFEAMLQYGKPVQKAPITTKILSSIRMNALPDFNIGGGCEPYLSIVQQNKCVFYSKPMKIKKGTQQIELDCGNILLTNDVKIQFYNKNSKGYMFGYCFHTAFLEGSRIHIRRLEIDKAHKDTKHFPTNFSIELIFCDDLEEFEQEEQQKKLFGTSYATGLAKLYQNNAQLKKNIDENIHKNNNTNNDNCNYSTSPNENNNKIVDQQQNNSNSSSSIQQNNNCNNNKERKSGKDLFICPTCNIAITSSEVSVNDGTNNYHWKCMVCNKCKKSLVEENDCLFQQNGETLCTDCGKENGFIKICSGCNLVIKTTDFEEFGNFIFHKSCFLCHLCMSYLGNQDFIVTVDKLLQCSICNEKIQLEKEREKENQRLLKLEKEKLEKEKLEKEKLEKEKLDSNIVMTTTTSDLLITTTINSVPMDTNDDGQEEDREKDEEIDDGSTTEDENSFITRYETIQIICHRCNEKVGLRPVILDSGVWHKECFLCFDCDQLLDSSLYFIKNDHPICLDCDRKYAMSNQFTCFGCKQMIVDDEMMDALGEKWHVSCLMCSSCNRLIEGPFGEHQGLIYCKEHYEELISIRCDHCRLIIDGTFVKANGKQLHIHCFVCFICGKVLQDGRYYDRGDNVICELCRSVDILKRRTQLQLQQTVLGNMRSSIHESGTRSALLPSFSSPDNNNQTALRNIAILSSSPSSSNNNNIHKGGGSFSSSASPPQNSYLCVQKTSPYRFSIKVHLSNLKQSTDGRRTLNIYPSFHRQMKKKIGSNGSPTLSHSFKIAYPIKDLGSRRDFLSLDSSLRSSFDRNSLTK
eukprot:gene2085-2572_t